MQRPGFREIYEKSKVRGEVAVGRGLVLTIAELKTSVPEDLHLDRAMSLWQDRAFAAIAGVALVLDDRIAHTVVLEDVLIQVGPDDVAIADRTVGLRAYSPANRVKIPQKAALAGLKSTSLAEERRSAAARWYLRGAQAGPTADGAVFYFIALESLVPGKKKKSFDVDDVKAAVQRAGGSPESVDPEIGRLAGLRADLVHWGKEQPPLLVEGYYALEWIARLLLRGEWGIDNTQCWPLRVGEPMLTGPVGVVARIAQQLPHRTIWIDP